MSVRADWGTQGLVEQDGADPFQMTEFAIADPDAKNWGAKVSIETPLDELRDRLLGLSKREAYFFEQGVTCPLKDNPEMSCIACPFSKAEFPEFEAKCQLCRVGVNQETIATLMIAKQAVGH